MLHKSIGCPWHGLGYEERISLQPRAGANAAFATSQKCYIPNWHFLWVKWDNDVISYWILGVFAWVLVSKFSIPSIKRCMYVCLSVLSVLSACLSVCQSAVMYVFLSVCLYVCIMYYVCMHLCMYMYVYVCICMYMYVYVCKCMYVYVCMYMYVYVCICM